MSYTLKEIRDRGMIIFEGIMGSRAYGTSLPTSDTDIRGIFIQPLDDILKYGYVDQVADTTNDTVFYELKRFMNLAAGNNPNILELINAPDDCILINSDHYMKIKENQPQFLSKLCKNTFGGYAIQQIKKARGLNKKINWDEKEMVRKTVLDFCYFLEGNGVVPVKNYINSMPGATQEIFGLGKITHAHDLYTVYVLDGLDQKKGIVKDEETANDVQIVSVPKDIPVFGHLLFNKDAYSSHCKLYREYKTWLSNRNEDRFKMNKAHGKNYDSKNMMHCIRLLDMATEIANTGKIQVRRSPDHVNILMSIRRGEMDYEPLLLMAEEKMKRMDKAFDESYLPAKPDLEFIKEIQFKIRKNKYKL